jgi:hypothetical protein
MKNAAATCDGFRELQGTLRLCATISSHRQGTIPPAAYARMRPKYRLRANRSLRHLEEALRHLE